MEKFRVGKVTAHRRSETASWSLYWRIDGKRYRRTTPTLKRQTAEEIATAVWKALREQDYTAVDHALSTPTPDSITFVDVLDAFEVTSPLPFKSLLEGQAPSSALFPTTVGYEGWEYRTWKGNKSIRKRLRQAWGDLHVQSITSTTIEQFLVRQEQISSTSTRNHYLTASNTVLKWAQKYKLLSTLPTRDLRHKRVVEHVPEALNAEEIDLLLEQLQPKEKKVVMFLHDTGLRVSEMTALLWKDVDLDRRIILIRNNKGSKDFRTVPLTKRATKILSDHQDAMVKSDFVELYPRLERNLRDQLGIAASKAKIRHVHPHIFRHTFATELVDEGVPLETIQKLLGHKGISMTLRYAKKRGKGLREAVGRLNR